jgi:hypothetical protein
MGEMAELGLRITEKMELLLKGFTDRLVKGIIQNGLQKVVVQ